MQYKQEGRTGCFISGTQGKIKCGAFYSKYIKNFKMAMAENQAGDHLGMNPVELYRLHVYQVGLEERKEIRAVLYAPVG